MRIRAIYFSPTGTTRQITSAVARQLAKRLGCDLMETPYTLPRQRMEFPPIEDDQIVVWGSPVYAGRIPNKTLEFIEQAIVGKSNAAIAIAVYGNRSFGDAAAEMCGRLEAGGMHAVAAAAMVARHAFASAAGRGRPSEEDYEELSRFVDSIPTERLCNPGSDLLKVDGRREPESYYVPLRADGEPAKFLKARPEVDENLCIRCGRCVERCPMGSIEKENGLPVFKGICIKCQACVKSCQQEAIAFADEDFLSHKEMLEKNYCTPKKNCFFV